MQSFSQKTFKVLFVNYLNFFSDDFRDQRNHFIQGESAARLVPSRLFLIMEGARVAHKSELKWRLLHAPEEQ